MLFGSASPGGFVNMVSKQPVDTPLRRTRLTFGNHNKVEQAFDFGGPVAGRDDLSYRLTGLARRASGITDVQKDERVAVAGALRWQAGASTSVTFFASLHRDPKQFNSVNPPRQAMLNPLRPRVPEKFYDGDAGWSGFERTQIHAGYELQHDFSDSVTLTQRVMYQKFKATTRELFVDKFASDDPASTVLERGGLFMKHDWGAVSTDTRLTAEATTGQVEHRLLFGLDAREMRGVRPFARMRNVPDIDYMNPDYQQPISDPKFTVRAKARVWQIGAYAQDQMKVGNWSLLAGVRHDWAGDYSDYNYLTDNSVESTNARGQALTWRLGAVYDLPGGWSPYASYSTSFQLQSGRDFFKRPFDPTHGKQFEAGVKYQPREDLLVTMAAFDLRRTNVLTPDPNPAHMCDGSRCSVQTGEVRSRGVELEAQGDLGAGWSLAGSASLWNVETTRSNDPTALGKTPAAVPSVMGALWVERAFDAGPARGLSIGGGLRHVGKTWADTANTIRVPAVTLVDASITYDLGQRFPQYQGMTLTANARNLLDRVNLASCDSETCSRGPRREVQVALDYRW